MERRSFRISGYVFPISFLPEISWASCWKVSDTRVREAETRWPLTDSCLCGGLLRVMMGSLWSVSWGKIKWKSELMHVRLNANTQETLQAFNMHNTWLKFPSLCDSKRSDKFKSQKAAGENPGRKSHNLVQSFTICTACDTLRPNNIIEVCQHILIPVHQFNHWPQ